MQATATPLLPIALEKSSTAAWKNACKLELVYLMHHALDRCSFFPELSFHASNVLPPLYPAVYNNREYDIYI